MITKEEFGDWVIKNEKEYMEYLKDNQDKFSTHYASDIKRGGSYYFYKNRHGKLEYRHGKRTTSKKNSGNLIMYISKDQKTKYYYVKIDEEGNLIKKPTYGRYVFGPGTFSERPASYWKGWNLLLIPDKLAVKEINMMNWMNENPFEVKR